MSVIHNDSEGDGEDERISSTSDDHCPFGL